MTDKTMTLEQVRDWHAEGYQACLDNGYPEFAIKHRDMADAITRHLSQPAERLGVVGALADMRDTVGGCCDQLQERIRELEARPAERGEAVVVGEVAGGDPRHDGKHMLYVTSAHPVEVGTKLYTAPPPAAGVPDVKEMVNRFLSWRLPSDFRPDGGISFTHVTDPAWSHDNWPAGTNLFHAGQAEQMIRHMLSAADKLSRAIGDAK